MIIPKIPYKASEIPEEIQRFAQLLSSHLQKILNPTKIDIGISEAFEEGIINVLPIYKEETFKSKRKKAEEKELADLQVELTLPPEKPQTEVIKMDSEPEEEEEPEEKKKKRKTPINRLKKAPKRQP